MDIEELQRMDREAMPPPWRFESYSSGGRVVVINAHTVTGEYGDRLPCSGISRCLYENRQVLCDCCPASARHWVGAKHDDQEWQDLAYIAELRNAAPILLAQLAAAEATLAKLREVVPEHHCYLCPMCGPTTIDIDTNCWECGKPAQSYVYDPLYVSIQSILYPPRETTS